MSFVSGPNSSWSWALDEPVVVDEHIHTEEDITIPIPLILQKTINPINTTIIMASQSPPSKFINKSIFIYTIYGFSSRHHT